MVRVSSLEIHVTKPYRWAPIRGYLIVETMNTSVILVKKTNDKIGSVGYGKSRTVLTP